MNHKPHIPLHWVGGFYYPSLDEWDEWDECKNTSEMELIDMMDKTDSVLTFDIVGRMLEATYIVDSAIERARWRSRV